MNKIDKPGADPVGFTFFPASLLAFLLQCTECTVYHLGSCKALFVGAQHCGGGVGRRRSMCGDLSPLLEEPFFVTGTGSNNSECG